MTLPLAAVSEGRDPPVDDRVGLPAAVQLVTEQVGGHDDGRPELGKDPLEGQLVDLEDRGWWSFVRRSESAAKIGGGHERRDDPLAHVRPGSVGDGPAVGAPDDLGDQAGRRRLAVRPDHEDGRTKLARQRGKGIGPHTLRGHPRQRGPLMMRDADQARRDACCADRGRSAKVTPAAGGRAHVSRTARGAPGGGSADHRAQVRPRT